MNRDDVVLRMAQQAGLYSFDLLCLTPEISKLERFAALVAAAERDRFTQDMIEYGKSMALVEREECAKVCDFEVDRLTAIDEPRPALAVGFCAAAIRARGKSGNADSLTKGATWERQR